MMNGTPVSKRNELRYEPIGSSCVHICADMQRLFAEPTSIRAPPSAAGIVGLRPSVTTLPLSK